MPRRARVIKAQGVSPSLQWQTESRGPLVGASQVGLKFRISAIGCGRFPYSEQARLLRVQSERYGAFSHRNAPF